VIPGNHRHSHETTVNLPAIVSLQDGERWRITLVHLSCQTVHRRLSRSGNTHLA
jgi:hypothetical protein